LREEKVLMGKVKGVSGQAFDITSIWISDDGHFEYIIKGDQSIVRTGPTIQEAEEFITLIQELVNSFKRGTS
jgi:hypothetical protein